MLYGSSTLTHYELCGHTAHSVWVGISKKKWLPYSPPPSFSLHITTLMLLVLDDVLRAMKNILILFQSGFSQTADYSASISNFTKSWGHVLLINPFEAL